jgi:hypothetical protein
MFFISYSRIEKKGFDRLRWRIQIVYDMTRRRGWKEGYRITRKTL